MTKEVLSHIVLEGEEGDRLDRLLARTFPTLSRTRAKALIEDGAVTAGAETIKDPSYRVKQGQPIAVAVPEARTPHVQPQNIPLDIRFEDDDVLVLDKPAGLVVHPAPGHHDGTLVNALLAHCGDSLSGIGGVRRPGIVHRIDKDTSGLLVVAKNDAAHAALAVQFEKHTVERAYTAVVWGTPTSADGVIEGNIGRNPRNRKKMAVLPAPRGKPALTHYKIMRRFGLHAAVIECRLATGRTHQIRVHCTHIGHPLIGDPLYGRARAARLEKLTEEAVTHVKAFARQALHASVIGFDHPSSGDQIRIESDLPNDIKQLISIL